MKNHSKCKEGKIMNNGKKYFSYYRHKQNFRYDHFNTHIVNCTWLLDYDKDCIVKLNFCTVLYYTDKFHLHFDLVQTIHL
jgi:hypothetical protein